MMAPSSRQNSTQQDLFSSISTDMRSDSDLPEGVYLQRGLLDHDRQLNLLSDILQVMDQAPPYRPRMRNGTPLANSMTNCGPLGWYSDEKGYRYIDHHPLTLAPWPPLPPLIQILSDQLSAKIGIADFQPDACLVNFYADDGRLGLHQDYDEVDFAWPIISFSLGASCRFVLGGPARRDPTMRFDLFSGDVLCLYGPSRKRFHGVAKIYKGTSPVNHRALESIARINLTLRRAR
jgi:alkylated DNA repair protein (DNA oxidative demethylase)